ncbi:scavenger receptor cysteine-rich type 1 protein M130-like isoform X2 [Stigmatopora argus]
MTKVICGKKHLLFLAIGLFQFFIRTECSVATVRLAGPSSTRCSGRVEVFHAGEWGSVCDDYWDMNGARVLCRELQCGSALLALKGGRFGAAPGPIWLDDLQCTGNEPSVLKCQHRPFGDNNCGHEEDAAVVCSEHLRVINGSGRCNGRLEVYADGHWNKMCGELGSPESKVLCREMSCGAPLLPPPQRLDFGQSRQELSVKMACLGNESSVAHCAHRPVKEGCEDATVSCFNSRPIRLVNGTDRCSGRVEILHADEWGTVCDDKWGLQEAAVACREMVCGAPLEAKYKAFFGVGHDQTWLDDLECTGEEKSLSECEHGGVGQHDCSHDEDAGVVCSETLRLSNQSTPCSGRLEVFHHGEWGKLCDRDWGTKEAQLACQALNCGDPSKSPHYFGESQLKRFASACPGDAASFSQCAVRDNPASCRGVSLSCTGHPVLRLVNGTDRCSGRVEFFHDGVWGTVCDDGWDIRDAQVVCRSLDCGTAVTAKSGAHFGQGGGHIWLDDVACLGNETSLLQCPRSSLGDNNCNHGEDAAVVCSANIRLINGTDQCSGRVEVYRQGRWSSVFDVQWTLRQAAVVCREMDCGDPVRASGSFGSGSDVHGYAVDCNGRETSLTRCSFRDEARGGHHAREASVQCSGNLRLAGGGHRCTGRVEFFHDGRWGDVCGESWDMDDAAVACGQLGCGRAVRITAGTEFGRGSTHVWIQQIECNGMESTLAQCPQRGFRERSCNATSLAGVVCSDSLEVRLAHSETECTGTVEVQHQGTWHSVCDADWTREKAEAVCERLECGRVAAVHAAAHYGQSSGPVVEADDACFANVSQLQRCSRQGFAPSSCPHDRDAGVACAAKLQLVGGWSGCSGRVEVFHAGVWGTVCDDEWEVSAADVVCRQLGCGHAVSAPSSAHFGQGAGPIWLDNVMCQGEELAITHCSHQRFGENNCGHSEDAGVICLGALEKPRIAVSPSAEVHWGQNVEFTCSIQTEQTGGTFLLKKFQGGWSARKFSESEAATFSLHQVNFSHRGSYFCEYQKQLQSNVIYFPQGDPVELEVKVSLEKPLISVTTHQVMVTYSPREVSVTRGAGFSVTCSVHSLYPHGTFYLRNTDSNVTAAKAAFGHSVFYVASFQFPDMAEKDRGDYVCLFAVNFSSKAFWSAPSTSLYINVVDTASSPVVSGLVSGLLLLLLLLVVVVAYLLWRRRRSQHAGTMIEFRNQFGSGAKSDFQDADDGGLEDRHGIAPAPRESARMRPSAAEAEAESENAADAERVPEDLAGRVCYELEPLVFS